jgi:hypothetical protein
VGRVDRVPSLLIGIVAYAGAIWLTAIVIKNLRSGSDHPA